MKRITLLYALAATLMVCSGCSDFLEEHNRSAVTTEGGYYDTEKGFESLINSCYTPLRFWGGKSAAMAFSETGTDILAPGGGCDYPAIVSYQNDFDGTNPISKEYYDRFYKAINFCNTAIYHVKNVIRFIIFILYQLKFYIQTKYKLFCHRERNTSSLFGIIIINLAESKEILCCSIYTESG